MTVSSCCWLSFHFISAPNLFNFILRLLGEAVDGDES